MKGHLRLLTVLALLTFVMASPEAIADPVAAARRAHTRARALMESGDTDGAIKIYEKALIFAPAYPLALNELGVLLIQKGEFEKARDHLKQAVQWMPDFLPAWSNLGVAQRRLEDEDGVIEAYGQVLRLAPADASAWYGLAMGLVDDREYGEARGALDRYIELAPETHPFRADAQAALDSLIALDVEAAEPELPAEAPFGPKPPPDPTDLPLPPFVNHPGDEPYAAHRFMEALTAYQAEALANPKDAVLLYKIGVVHAVMGDYLNARRWWGKSVVVAPDRQFFLRHAALAALTQAHQEDDKPKEPTSAPPVDEQAPAAEPTEGGEPEPAEDGGDTETTEEAGAPEEPSEEAATSDTGDGEAAVAEKQTEDPAPTPTPEPETTPAPPPDPVEIARRALMNQMPSFAWVTLQDLEGAEATYLRAEAALRMGNFAEARDTFKAAASLANEADVGPWGGLAEALVRLGDKEAAAGAIRDWLNGRTLPEGEFLLLRSRAARARIRNGPPTPPTPEEI